MCAQASALSVRACCDDGARHEVDAHEAVLRMWSWYMVRIDQASKTKAWAGRSGKCRWEKKLRDGGNACRAGRPGRLGHRNTHRLLTKSSSWFLASERSSQRLLGGGSGVAGAPALQETLQSSRPVLRRGRYPHQPSRATGTAWTRGASVYVPAKINTILPTRRASIRRRFGDRQ